MFIYGWLQIILLLFVLYVLTKPLGRYLFLAFERNFISGRKYLGYPERLVYCFCGIDPKHEQNWFQYAVSVGIFLCFGVLVLLLIQLTQQFLPLNPEAKPGVDFWLALNTAVSFSTNTNWQSYAGESSMSLFTQMVGFTWQNFVSAATGLAVAFAVMRGLTRKQEIGSPQEEPNKTLGNFYVDLVRGILYVLMPLSLVFSLLFVSQGVAQNLIASQSALSIEGKKIAIPAGPIASQEAIKVLGTNGGGFFNANSAHPMENPTPLSNFLQILAMLMIPSALAYTFGLMCRKSSEGWILWAAMMLLFLLGTCVVSIAEVGNMEGKETRFGTAGSALYATATTATSCGAVNSMHDSYHPLSLFVLMLNMQLGEIVFGGVGSGLYGMLVFVLLTVFIAGLLVGRTPEYLGKKIESHEMKLIVCFLIIVPVTILIFSACSFIAPWSAQSLNNDGSRGFSEILYAYSSAAENNGSALAGLSANTVWFNTTLALTMLIGRIFTIIPILAIAGSMVGKKTVPASNGTLPTDNILFLILLLGTILIVGALTFFPALTLGPILECFQ